MYTTHGHHIPGTSVEPTPDVKNNCGGVQHCAQCRLESGSSRGFVQPPGMKITALEPPPMTDEELRETSVDIAAVLMAPSAAVEKISILDLFEAADLIGNYIRTGEHKSGVERR